MVQFDLSSSLNLTVFANFADERGRMRDELIHKFLYEIEHSLSSAVLDFQSRIIYGFCKDVPYICCYCLPEKVGQNLSLPSFMSAIKIDTWYYLDLIHALTL